MSTAVTLRLRDVRRAFRLIGDCRDVGDDTSQWQELAMRALSRLIGGDAVTGGEGHWHRPLKPPAPVSAYSVGLDESAKALLSNYLHEFGVNADPVFRSLQRRSGRLETVRRVDLVSDRDWYRAGTFVDYCRPVGLDHSLTSVYQRPRSNAISCLRLHRARWERDFSDRECALAAFFHYELGRLIGGSLASALDSEFEPLSPRLRETLAYLMEGHSEKQVAMRMGLSHTTVHQYVTMLYRRFDVQSRAELLAKVLRRRGSRHGLPR
jgi:DNA-binding CsgD family transcriptional regulator